MSVIIVGGNVNLKLRRWLKELGILNFEHISARPLTISPDDINAQGELLQYLIPPGAIVISVGTMANRILNSCRIDHAALPSTTTTDMNKIKKSIKQCKQYLITRSYYGHYASPRTS